MPLDTISAPRHTGLPLTGLTCAGCANRVQKALAAVPGVTSASVNLALERAEIDFSAPADPASLEKAIRDAGYGVRTEEIGLDITGMTCASCARQVQTALAAVPGVLGADVNPATDRAQVRIAAGTRTANLIAAIRAAGYDAALPEAIARTDTPRDRDLIELGLAALLTLPLVAQMVSMVTPLGIHLSIWTELALATPVQFWFGRRFYLGAYKAAKARSSNMDTLVALGSSAAYLYSLVTVLTLGSAARGQLYFEAAAVIITLVLFGKYLETRAKRSASSALRALMELRPDTARILRDGTETELPVAQVAIGDIAVIRPGERVPVDGIVTEGRSEIDESLITGEPVPVLRSPGDRVTAGAINGNGALRVETDRIGKDTTLARIAHLVEQAQTGRAPIQKLVDRIAAVFVPAVLVLAAVTLTGWLVSGATVETALGAAISVLVIACPCALGLATPTALVAGTGIAARHGILIRDIEALERAATVDIVVFDKTGTLTIGKPEVTAIEPFGSDKDTLLALAAAVQSRSEHPLGRAIVTAAGGLDLPQVSDFKAEIGNGVEGVVDGATIRIGRASFAVADPEPTRISRADALEAEGNTVVWVSRDRHPLGLIALADTPRDDARTAIDALHHRALRTALLTGDNRATAEKIAKSLGIDDVTAGVHPDEKAARIEALTASGAHVAMVGDGINDAPALAAAHLGIAMSGGADVAMESADIALMRPKPSLVADALDIARATHAKIRQNLFWAFGYNIVCLPLAAFGFLNPAIAGAAMAMSSVSVVANALTLKRWRPEAGR